MRLCLQAHNSAAPRLHATTGEPDYSPANTVSKAATLSPQAGTGRKRRKQRSSTEVLSRDAEDPRTNATPRSLITRTLQLQQLELHFFRSRACRQPGQSFRQHRRDACALRRAELRATASSRHHPITQASTTQQGTQLQPQLFAQDTAISLHKRTGSKKTCVASGSMAHKPTPRQQHTATRISAKNEHLVLILGPSGSQRVRETKGMETRGIEPRASRRINHRHQATMSGARKSRGPKNAKRALYH